MRKKLSKNVLDDGFDPACGALGGITIRGQIRIQIRMIVLRTGGQGSPVTSAAHPLVHTKFVLKKAVISSPQLRRRLSTACSHLFLRARGAQ